MENEQVVINVDIDTKGAEAGIGSLVQAVKALGVSVTIITASLVKSFSGITASMKSMEVGLYTATNSMVLLTQQMNNLAVAQGQVQSGGWREGLSAVGDVSTILQTVITLMDTLTIAKMKSRAEDIAIIALYATEYVTQFGIMIGQLAASTAAWVAETAAKVANTAAQWAQIAATTAWQAICVAATAVTTAFGAAVNFLTSPIGLVVVAITALIAIVVLLVKNWDTVKAAALSVWETIRGAFGKAWEWFKTTLLDPLSEGFKSTANGIIGFINGLITGAVKGINGIIGLLNKLQFTVPDWVPGLGGKSLGFNIKTITAPQIPYLAKGAVLPANKPFLAVVGDQRHGTNVEAPLATIQEAVALVMNDHISAMMAGFEALLQEQRVLRQTVEGIELGDSVIGRAAQRYNRKMAIVKGGY